MKIKTDFVTNSSSASYIITINKQYLNNFKEFMKELADDEENYNGTSIYQIIKSLKKLKSYASDRNSDWVSNALSVEYINMNEDNFNKCKEEIEDGQVIVLCSVDYGLTDIFESKYSQNILDETT